MPLRALLLLLLAGPAVLAAEPGLQVTYGPEGPTSLRYRGAEVLAPGGFQCQLAGEDGKPLPLKDPKLSGDKSTFTRIWEDAAVTSAFQQQGDALKVTLTVRNTGAQAITRAACRPLQLRFPRRPAGGRWFWGYDVLTENQGEPGIVEADWGAAKLAACVDEPEKPCLFGFGGNFGNSDTNSLRVETAPGERIAPGGERTWRFSLRFAPAGTPTAQVAGEVYRAFAKAFPYTLKWEDRRPIGAIFLARDNTKWKTNPRGWLNDEKLDVTTDEGRKLFRERLMEHADRSIAVLKDVGAQGMIVWDIEGAQMPHAITYLGDPRVLPQEAPEMDAIADDYFRKFRDAGLKVGVCIRPSRVVPDGNGGWKHLQVEDHVAEMADKIAYAKKRWGCTIFYMDTNVKWSKGMWQGDSWLLHSRDMVELCRRHPDVLIFPEFGRFGYYSVCMPYGELRGGNTGVPDGVRAAYPRAGRTIAVADGDYLGRWDDLLAGAERGDIHLFRGWFPDTYNAYVKRLQQEVALRRQAAAMKVKAGPLPGMLADPDPVVRYKVVAGLQKPDAGQAAALLKRLPEEPEWAVRRRMVMALGASGQAAAVPALLDLAKNGKDGLDVFAARALGQIGPPATDALAALAADKDPRLAERALEAFAGYEDDRIAAAVLPLAGSESARTRTLAALALGGCKDAKARAKLVEMLGDADPGVLSAACRALGRFGSKEAVPALVALIERSVTTLHDNNVRAAAGQALEALTGLQYGPYEGRWKKALGG